MRHRILMLSLCVLTACFLTQFFYPPLPKGARVRPLTYGWQRIEYDGVVYIRHFWIGGESLVAIPPAPAPAPPSPRPGPYVCGCQPCLCDPCLCNQGPTVGKTSVRPKAGTICKCKPCKCGECECEQP